MGARILASGILPNVAVVVVLLAIVGIGKTTLDTAGFTLLQRTVPNDRRSHVFALLEAIIAAALGAEPIAAAVLIDRLGARPGPGDLRRVATRPGARRVAGPEIRGRRGGGPAASVPAAAERRPDVPSAPVITLSKRSPAG